MNEHDLYKLIDKVKSGRMPRRRFIEMMVGAGLTVPMAGGSLIGAVRGDVDFFAGAVFQLTPPSAGGACTYTQLWDFNRGPDRNPLNVVTGRGRNLFGVLQGGDSTSGSLFELR